MKEKESYAQIISALSLWAFQQTFCTMGLQQRSIPDLCTFEFPMPKYLRILESCDSKCQLFETWENNFLSWKGCQSTVQEELTKEKWALKHSDIL